MKESGFDLERSVFSDKKHLEMEKFKLQTVQEKTKELDSYEVMGEHLISTGRGLDNPREANKSQVNDLDNTLSEHVFGKIIRTPLTNPLACNVKWDGEDEHWKPQEACDLV